MRNFLVFCCLVVIMAIATIIGVMRESTPLAPKRKPPAAAVPYIGSIQVLNGCGAEGAANKVADFLRSKNFDVKSIGNADTWNYPFTMVIARSQDMTIAQQIAHVLTTDKMTMVRTNEQAYDVTVVIGPDYVERIK
jgi:hypothetical protein